MLRCVSFLLLLGFAASAESLAAPYSLCFLGNGPRAGSFDKPTAAALQEKHMAHIQRMWEAGVLESAGPVGDLPGVRAIFVFSVPLAEAQRWTNQDPKLQAGDLSVSCYLWNAPAAVGQDYRARYGKPGFQEKMLSLRAVFSQNPLPASLVSGALDHPEWKHFQVLPENSPTPTTGKTFRWFHDPQVWPSRSSE
ncbi:MAG: hypothetical protein NW208_16485 [Bryobacter sp.]|nr:hypothetical protein [Bryobacter sp.]